MLSLPKYTDCGIEINSLNKYHIGVDRSLNLLYREPKSEHDEEKIKIDPGGIKTDPEEEALQEINARYEFHSGDSVDLSSIKLGVDV